jgi:hypothetical protein
MEGDRVSEAQNNVRWLTPEWPRLIQIRQKMVGFDSSKYCKNILLQIWQCTRLWSESTVCRGIGLGAWMTAREVDFAHPQELGFGPWQRRGSILKQHLDVLPLYQASEVSPVPNSVVHLAHSTSAKRTHSILDLDYYCRAHHNST